jgi:hypothetical protein
MDLGWLDLGWLDLGWLDLGWPDFGGVDIHHMDFLNGSGPSRGEQRKGSGDKVGGAVDRLGRLIKR